MIKSTSNGITFVICKTIIKKKDPYSKKLVKTKTILTAMKLGYNEHSVITNTKFSPK